MSRKWLIRTYSKQILGPVSKSKIQELVQKGILGVGDEIASGNGFWFNVNEKELYEKYVIGDVPQTFNPVSEAPNILTSNDGSGLTSSIQKLRPIDNKQSLKSETPVIDQKVLIPTNEDLEFPDLDNIIVDESFEDLTVVGQVIPSSTTFVTSEESSPTGEAEEGATYPRSEDLEYPQLKISPQQVMEKTKKEEVSEISVKEKVEELKESPLQSIDIQEEEVVLSHTAEEITEPSQQKIQQKKKNTILKSKTFYFVLLFLMIVASLFVLYFKMILKRPLPYISSLVSISIPVTNAQEFVVEGEKKKLL